MRILHSIGVVFLIGLSSRCLCGAEAAPTTAPTAAPTTAPITAPTSAPTTTPAIRVLESDEAVTIETDAISATIRKKGYVSGIAGGSFVDRRTGARDLGFGLHIMDFLMAPGWRQDGYERSEALHGDLPKHYVEGPQLCTQAGELPVRIVRGEGFVAVRMQYVYTQPGKGYRAGSRWEQTIVFRPGVRYVLSAERIISANDVDHLFYRLDMPGHVRHKKGDTFERIYLSYLGEPLPASAFAADFAPDAKHLYQRKEGAIPDRMIRAYQVKIGARPGPWLAGMTLDPGAVAEAWCHQRGYVCFIEELHGRAVKAGEAIGAAYVIGWFDDIPEMQKVYDQYKGTSGVEITGGELRLIPAVEGGPSTPADGARPDRAARSLPATAPSHTPPAPPRTPSASSRNHP